MPGKNSSQIASSFNWRSPSIHCSGTEKFPPPWRYFAAKPQPRNTVIRRTSRRNTERPTRNAEYRIQKRLSTLDIGLRLGEAYGSERCWMRAREDFQIGRAHV